MLTVIPRRRHLWTRSLLERVQAPLILIAGVVAAFWKLVLTDQYSFLQHYDANQFLPWLQVQVFALRHWQVLLWDPYEWGGQSLVGQLQPGVFSPFKWLLALAPLDSHGHIKVQNVHLWFALLHVVAALFAYCLFRDLACRKPAAVLGALFYGVAGFLGNTPWPQMVEAALWSPLVFLFLLRSLRGRAPMRNAAVAGVALGLSWCGGHHGPSIALSLSAGAVCLWAILASGPHKRQAIARSAVMLTICGMVAAVQILPSLEYGKRSVRWTATGAKQWSDEIPYTEHEDYGLSPVNLINTVVPGGNGLMGDPFTGVVALSFAVLAVWTDFRRREVRVFLAVAVGALLYSMARSDLFYGVIYAVTPFIRKSREPVLAISVFQFAMAGMVALGADRWLKLPDERALRMIQRGLIWFGLATFGLFFVFAFLRPTGLSTLVETDPRVGMIALVALLFAGVVQAVTRGVASPLAGLVLAGCLLLIEQGNETGSRWMHNSDKGAVVLAPFSNTQDLADFLHQQPKPYRIELDRKAIEMNFGDWNNIDAMVQYTPTAPADTTRLQWWQDRMAQLYGVEYTVARAASRPGQQELFTGASGLKIFRNPLAFPRAWTVHQITVAPNEDRGAVLVRDGTFDLRTRVVMTGATPGLATCDEADTVDEVSESAMRVRVDVRLACMGMLVVSDNWFPGWAATVDGKSARIWKTDTTFRGVVVPAGQHQVVMSYRPFSVYAGGALALLGFGITLALRRRREADGVELWSDISTA